MAVGGRGLFLLWRHHVLPVL